MLPTFSPLVIRTAWEGCPYEGCMLEVIIGSVFLAIGYHRYRELQLNVKELRMGLTTPVSEPPQPEGLPQEGTIPVAREVPTLDTVVHDDISV
jgi:hypothetical protein